MNIDLLKLAEFYTHPDDEFDTIGPLDVTTIWTDDTRTIFVVSFWVQDIGGARVLIRRSYSRYSDAINAALGRSGWGDYEMLTKAEIEDMEMDQ